MEIHKAMEAHVAWKLRFAPYLAQQDGTLCAVAVEIDPARKGDAATVNGQVVALPTVTTVDDRRAHVNTRVTAVLIQAGTAPESQIPLTVRPLPAGEPHAALNSITRLKGRFTA
jgi:hypothetical protein